jgi:CubicO group peptidase (beta-lactamase class C family)
MAEISEAPHGSATAPTTTITVAMRTAGLIVETDLELNAGKPGFDAVKVDALIDAAMKSFPASGGTIDRVHLVPVR